jgi:hypothetical protein
MKVNEFVKNLEVWTSSEEKDLLESITEPKVLASFDERDRTIIDSLIRKSLLIKVQGKHSSYVYPNV